MTQDERPEQYYDYRLVQTGSLPLDPEAEYHAEVEHRCTSVLIWPRGESPSRRNSILTDPCLTPQGYQEALECLRALHCTFEDVEWIFVTHAHRDHRSNLSNFLGQSPGKAFHQRESPMPGLSTLLLSGHTPTQQGLMFRTLSQGMVCVTGDAVLDSAWLRAWKYYWPNFYREPEIVQTWRSLAAILTRADTIIPGHGVPLTVSVQLLEHLIETFPREAEHAGQCPDVRERLQIRLEHLRDGEHQTNG